MRVLTESELRRSVFNNEIDVRKLAYVVEHAMEELSSLDDKELGGAVEAILDAAVVAGLDGGDPEITLYNVFSTKKGANLAQEVLRAGRGEDLDEEDADEIEESLEEMIDNLFEEVEVISKHKKPGAAMKKIGGSKLSKYSPFVHSKVKGPGPRGRVLRLRTTADLRRGQTICRKCTCGKNNKKGPKKTGVCTCLCAMKLPDGKYAVVRRTIDMSNYWKSGRKAKYAGLFRKFDKERNA